MGDRTTKRAQYAGQVKLIAHKFWWLPGFVRSCLELETPRCLDIKRRLPADHDSREHISSKDKYT